MAQRASPRLFSVAQDLFLDPAERAEFVEAMAAGDCKEQALIVLQDKLAIQSFPRARKLAWQPGFVERIDFSFRASKHPLYESGAYYTLDFSSIFSCSAMLEVKTPVRRILDLCASPGGKAIFSWRMFQPELLLCNETIRKRSRRLIENLHRCRIERSAVWSADPSVYARRYQDCFDLVICDAPCSGQSLIAKGESVPDCWHPRMIDMNVGRQRRILGNAVRCLAPGGYLMYATCTFSIKENEKIIDWLVTQHEWLTVVELPHLAEFRSRFYDFPSYRLYPHQGLGAGAFVALIRDTREPRAEPKPIGEVPALWRFGDPPPEMKAPADAETAPAPEFEAEEHPELSARQIVKRALGISKANKQPPEKRKRREPAGRRKPPKPSRRGARRSR